MCLVYLYIYICVLYIYVSHIIAHDNFSTSSILLDILNDISHKYCKHFCWTLKYRRDISHFLSSKLQLVASSSPCVFFSHSFFFFDSFFLFSNLPLQSSFKKFVFSLKIHAFNLKSTNLGWKILEKTTQIFISNIVTVGRVSPFSFFFFSFLT